MTVIHFDHVSKLYRLGTRANLRDAIARVGERFRKTSTKDAREFWALNDVSFKVDRGEILGLIGPNGAGKTTALNLLAGITAATKGRVSIDGRVAALIQLGAGFHPDLTGRENIYLNGSILGLKRREIERQLDSIIDFSGLEQFIDTPVKRYSSGMYVRLGFAVAAHVDPDVLLIDEVLAVGDAAFRQKCWARLRELRETDATIVFVSHDMWAVQGLVDRAILLSAGQIRAQGPPATVIEAYQEAVNESNKVRGQQAVKTGLSARLDDRAEVVITGVRILDESGSERSTFRQGEEMVVEMEYQVSGGEEQVEMELRIERSDGLSCSVSRMTQKNIEAQFVRGNGRYQARISPVQLTAGSYVAYPMAVHPPPLSFEFCRQALPFQVVGSPEDLKPGIFYPLVEWVHNGQTLEPTPSQELEKEFVPGL
jgi:lipopolysaccharide transport system ATP-binding protein